MSALVPEVAPPAVGEAGGATLRWRHDAPGLAVGALFALVLGLLGWSRYANHLGTVDLALFDQGVWLLSRGRAPELTVIPENLFGDHVSPGLIVFVPFYLLRATPLWLIGGQALALGAAVPAMRSLARQMGASVPLATVATVGSAPLWAAAMFDVHPVAMTVPVTAVAIAAGRRDDLRIVTLCALAIALIRFDACVMLLGVAVLAQPRARRRLLILAPVGMAIGVIIPVLLHSEQTFSRYWGHLGRDPLDAALHPWRLGPALVSGSLLFTLAIWLLPVGFLPLGRSRWLAAIGIGGLPLLLSSAAATSLPYFHHAAALVPFTIGGALAALAQPHRPWERPAALLLGVALALAVTSPFTPVTPRSASAPGVLMPRGSFDDDLAVVADGDAVAAPVWLLPRLSARASVRPISDVLGEAYPDRDEADIDVILAEPDDAPALRDRGWDVRRSPSGELVIARR